VVQFGGHLFPGELRIAGVFWRAFDELPSTISQNVDNEQLAA